MNKEMKSGLPDVFSDLISFTDNADMVWIEDLSAVKGYLDLKKDEGVQDFRNYFNKHPEELIICRRLIHIVDANTHFLQFFGIHEIDKIHEDIFSFFPIEALPAFRDELIALSEGDAGFKAILSIKDLTGNLKEVEVRSTPFPGYEKTFARVFFSCTDITERLHTMHDLCDSWAIINRFIRCVNVPIFAWDLNMKIILYNSAIADLTGISQDEAIGKDISRLFPEKHEDSTYEMFTKASMNESLKLTMIPIHQRSGDIRTILWNSARVTNTKGEGIGTIAQGIDITEQKWAKEYLNRYISELREKNDELEQIKYQLEIINQSLDEKVRTRSKDIEELLKQKDEFITQIGHDLKTPLTPLLSILPVLRKKEEDPKRIEYLDMAIRNASQIHEILINIIHLARLNKSYFPNTGTVLPIHQMIEEIVINFEPEILKKRILVDYRIPADLWIRINPIDFDTIFENLLDNAIKCSFTGGTITFEGEKIEDSIIIRIRDTGVGLLPMQKDQVFEKFYKGDSSRHDGKSYGLGLSITQKIVEKYGGMIKVESEGSNLGAVFILTFPNRMEHDI